MPDVPYQMVNLGVQAYGTDQALIRLERHFDEFDTRAVVYTFIAAHLQRNDNDDRRLLYPTARFLSTKPEFALRSDGTLFLDKRPILYRDLSYSRIWACLRLRWQAIGPPPSVELTRALIREMRDYVESRGAEFFVVNWDQDTPMSAVPAGRPGPLAGLDVRVLDTRESAPPAWDDWTIRGDGHPDGRAHRRVANLIAKELRGLER